MRLEIGEIPGYCSINSLAFAIWTARELTKKRFLLMVCHILFSYGSYPEVIMSESLFITCHFLQGLHHSYSNSLDSNNIVLL